MQGDKHRSSSSFNAVELGSQKDTESMRASLLNPRENSKLCFCIPASWIMLPPEGEEVEVKNSNTATIFLLLNTMIGSGIVVQAYVFSKAGIVAAIFEYIIVGIVMYMGVELLIRSAERADIFNYSQLADTVLGPWGRFTVDMSITINNAGALLSYILIIGSLSHEVVDSMTYGPCDEWWCNAGFLTVFPIVIFTIPLCCIRNFGHLAIISYLSVAVIASIVLLVLIGGPVHRVYYDQTEHDRTIKTGSFYGCIATVGDIVFALGYITAIFHAYHGMEHKNVQNFTNVAKIVNSLGVIMCFVTGFVGYLCFMGDVDSNIVSNFDGPIGAIFKIALISHLILYIPGDFVVMRSSLWRLLETDITKQSDRSFMVTTLSLISLVTVIAIILQVCLPDTDSLAVVVNVSGGIAGSVVYFLIPGMCTLKLFPEDQSMQRMGYGVALFGAVLMSLVFASAAM